MKKQFSLVFLFFTTALFAKSLEFIGNPLLDYSVEAAKINTLKAYDGKLYLGFGDAGYNTGETDIISYSPKTGEFNVEGRVQDEAITQYCEIDSFLIIPGVDATEDWDLGNLYYRTKKDNWVKKRTIPNGIHVFDAVKHEDNWFIGTGSFFNLTKDINDQNLYAFGGIFTSNDLGNSWNLSYATPSDSQTTYRISKLFKVGDELYATFYAYYAVDPNSLTKKELEKYKDVPRYQGYILLVRENLFGDADLLHYENGIWKVENKLPIDDFAYSKIISLKNKAIITSFSGKNIPFQSIYQFSQRDIFILENESIEKAEFPFADIIAYAQHKNEVTCLVTIDKKLHLARTYDLKDWRIEDLDTILNLRSIEFLNDELFFGDFKGNLYRYNEKEKSTSFAFQAQKFAQGEDYNIKISEWIDWSEKVNIEMYYDNKSYDIQTKNIRKFYLNLDEIRKKKLAIRIDKTSFKKKIPDNIKTIEFTLKKEWEMKFHEEQIDELNITEPIISEIEFPKMDIKKWQQIIKIKSISLALNVDIILAGTAFRDILKDEKVRASDIFNINYDNNIYEIKLTGESIKKIISNNKGISYWNSSKVVSDDLNNDKYYRVAVTDYFYKNKLSDYELKFKTTGTSVNKAMLNYFILNK